MNRIHDLAAMRIFEVVDSGVTEVRASDAVPRYYAAYEGRLELPVYRPVTVAALGISAIQLLGEISRVTTTTWITRRPMFDEVTEERVRWSDGTTLRVDAILWCTGFRSALEHLAPLMLREPNGGIVMTGRLAASTMNIQPESQQCPTSSASTTSPRSRAIRSGTSTST